MALTCLAQTFGSPSEVLLNVAAGEPDPRAGGSRGLVGGVGTQPRVARSLDRVRAVRATCSGLAMAGRTGDVQGAARGS